MVGTCVSILNKKRIKDAHARNMIEYLSERVSALEKLHEITPGEPPTEPEIPDTPVTPDTPTDPDTPTVETKTCSVVTEANDYASDVTFTEGMTWGAWFESEYKDADFSIGENNEVMLTGSGVLTKDEVNVLTTDTITEGYTYIVKKVETEPDTPVDPPVAETKTCSVMTEAHDYATDVTFTEGMTWHDWLASEYKDDDFSTSDNNEVMLTGSGVLTDGDGVTVKVGDLMIENAVYIVISDQVTQDKYTVSIYTQTQYNNNGVMDLTQLALLQTLEYDAGTVIESGLDTFFPLVPSKEGYSKATETNFPLTVDSDKTVIYQYILNKYYATFKVDGETVAQDYKPYTFPIEYPADPTKEGYIFKGWDNNPTTMPIKGVTINAIFEEIDKTKTATITFNPPSFSDPITVTYEEGMTWGEWMESPYYDARFSIADNGSVLVANEYTTTHVSSSANNLVMDDQCQVYVPVYYYTRDEVYSNGEIINGEYTLYKKRTIGQYNTDAYNLSVDPKEGYTFAGWDELPKNIKVETNVYGTFKLNSYTAIFMVDGTTYDTKTIYYGTPVQYPDNPTKDGYTFTGWDTQPDTMPANNITLTAQFTKNEGNTFMISDGSGYSATYNFTAGQTWSEWIDSEMNTSEDELAHVTAVGGVVGVALSDGTQTYKLNGDISFDSVIEAKTYTYTVTA